MVQWLGSTFWKNGALERGRGHPLDCTQYPFRLECPVLRPDVLKIVPGHVQVGDGVTEFEHETSRESDVPLVRIRIA